MSKKHSSARNDRGTVTVIVYLRDLKNDRIHTKGNITRSISFHNTTVTAVAKKIEQL